MFLEGRKNDKIIFLSKYLLVFSSSSPVLREGLKSPNLAETDYFLENLAFAASVDVC